MFLIIYVTCEKFENNILESINVKLVVYARHTLIRYRVIL